MNTSQLLSLIPQVMTLLTPTTVSKIQAALPKIIAGAIEGAAAGAAGGTTGMEAGAAAGAIEAIIVALGA